MSKVSPLCSGCRSSSHNSTKNRPEAASYQEAASGHSEANARLPVTGFSQFPVQLPIVRLSSIRYSI